MKMKLASRVIWVLGALLLPVIGVLTVLLAFHTQPIAMNEVDLFSWERLLLAAIGIALIAYGAFLLLLPRRLRKSTAPFIAQQTAGGELRISIRAIENIIKKCAGSMPDLKLIQMDVAPVRGSVRADLNLSMPGNVSIPLAAEQLQTLIVKQLQATAGIESADVRISVETTEADAADGLQLQAPLPKIEVPDRESVFAQTASEEHEHMADGAAEETLPDDTTSADDGEKLPEEDTPEESKEETSFLTEGAAQNDQVMTNFENADEYGGEQEHEDERKEL